MAKKRTVEEMINELAVMVARGFSETATKASVENTRKDIDGFREDVEKRLDRIEFNTKTN